jgi:hypothetical protein
VKIIIRLFSKCHSGGGEAPENVSKNEVFYRAEKSNHLGYFLPKVFAVPKGRTELRKYVGRML